MNPGVATDEQWCGCPVASKCHIKHVEVCRNMVSVAEAPRGKVCGVFCPICALLAVLVTLASPTKHAVHINTDNAANQRYGSLGGLP